MADRRSTARDIAAELSVSVKTVSNAFRRPDQLSAGLRDRILATAAARGYGGPDPVAGALRRGRVGVIGVAYANRLSYAFDDPVSRELLAGMTGAAEDEGAGLLLLPGSAESAHRSAVMSNAVVDGLVACSLADDDPLLATAIERGLPTVVVDQPRPPRLAELAPGVPWIGVDDRAAADEAAEHLLSLGYRRLAVICFGLHRAPTRGMVDSGRPPEVTYAVSRDRLAGYRAAVERHRLDWAAVPVHQGTDSTPDEGEAGALAVLGLTPRPTALLCMSDRLAEGALRAALRLGLRVPGEVSVVGFDDAEPIAATLGLTTVRQPHRLKGSLAAQALLDLLSGRRPPPVRRVLPTEFMTRESTTMPPA